jgi:hypothetical protein
LSANIDEPDWEYMLLNFGGIADVLVPNTRSFLAETVWKYIQSDPKAKAFMAGNPDENGMVVNPWFCTDSKINPSGSAFSLENLSFPKSDPIEKPDTTLQGGDNPTGAVNLVTWRPYLNEFESGAQAALTGNAYELGPWDFTATPPAFKKGAKSPLGRHSVLALTTTPAADKFQAFQASFLNPAGFFVEPSPKGLAAARDAMTATKANAKILEFDFASKKARSASNAYPLAVPLYAAINPVQEDVASRAAFANLIRFAATQGQTPGTNPGNLPPGYAALTTKQVKEALEAAETIEKGVSPLEVQNQGQETVEPAPEPPVLPEVVIKAGETPEDPATPVSSASIPVAFSLFLCSLMFYAFIRKRIARV